MLKCRAKRILFPLLFLSVLPLQAVDWKALKPQGYVSDFANVIDAATRTSLEQYGASVEKSTGTQMAFVTISSLEREPIEDVANDLFRAWGIGQKNKDNGVLLLLVINDRRSRLEVGNGLEETLPDGFDGLLLDNMRPALRDGQYGQALLTAAQAIGEAIAKARNVKIGAPAGPVKHVIQHRHQVPWIPILFWLFIFWLMLRANSRRRYAATGYPGWGGGGGLLNGIILGDALNNVSYGGRGGGGFGGYDSGGATGGFGGFGGGDSGGGGASSDW